MASFKFLKGVNMIENNQNEVSNYEEEKRIKKLKITRNEFKTVGKYGMPLIKKQDIDLDKVNLWNYTKTKNNDDEHKDKTIHFLLMIGTLIMFMKSQKWR